MSISKKLKQYKNKNIHIVGIGGAEGSAIAEFLVSHGISSITGHDFSSKADFKKSFWNTHLSLKLIKREDALNHLLNLPIKINFKDHYLEDIEEADLVFVSQVWFKYPQNLPILGKLKDNGVQFKTITNLYFELAPCKIISVTGTNGKTTTARLINSIFETWTETKVRSLKPNVYFAGNDRQNIQVLDKLGEMTENDFLILETSSTQLLLNLGVSPQIGVITNITPNHIDDHGSFENYIEAKKNLIRCQKTGDWAVLNWDDAQTRKIAKEFKNNTFLFSRKEKFEKGCFIENGNIIIRGNDRGYGIGRKILKRIKNKGNIICDVSAIKIPGNHNLENVLAAVAVASLYGIDSKIIKKGILEYTGTKHRLKLLYNIDGIKYYDDTQATTPEATIAGIESFDGDIILLAGGDDKGMNYEKLAEKINDKVKLLILFSDDTLDKIEKLIDKNKIDLIKVKNFKQAVEELKRYYKKTDPIKDGTVLISPAAAHFYSKYIENSDKSLREWIKLIKQ